jgi:hypothetical protein
MLDAGPGFTPDQVVQTGLELTTFGRAFIRAYVQPYDGNTKHAGSWWSMREWRSAHGSS